MDASVVTSNVNQAMMSRTGNQASLDALKVSMELQKLSANQLIEAVPEVKPNNPPHLGQNLDVTA